jgi:hypothetical protein
MVITRTWSILLHVHIYINLFKKSVNNPDYIVSSNWKIVNNGLERMWEKVVLA